MPDKPRPKRPTTQTGTGHGFLYDAVDRVIEKLAGDSYTEEVARARAEYEDRRGRVFEDEDLWERWTQSFLEWYAVERPMSSSPRGRSESPVVYALGTISRTMADLPEYRADFPPPFLDHPSGDLARLQTALAAWARSHRSLYEVRALHDGRVELLDLLSGGQFSVREKRALAGVSVGDVAEVRLIGFEVEVVFGRTFCFHPTGTKSAILAHADRIRAAGGSRLDVVDYCASLRIRCERYRHVSPPRIYEAAPRSSSGRPGARATGPLTPPPGDD